MASTAHDSIVRIIALKSRPELNGTFAVVLPPETEEERSSLQEKDRIKVSSFPKTLALKKENIQVLSDEEVAKIDWSFGDFALPGEHDNATLLAVIKHEQSMVGCLDVCDHFASAVWNAVGQGQPMPPKTALTRDRKELIMNNTAGHHVYILGLDQVGHHIVLETRAGLARFFQSYAKTDFLERPDLCGFTGREWLIGKPDTCEKLLPPGMLQARKRWNVPNNLRRGDLEDLLDVVFQLQACAKMIAEKMLSQLPPNVQAEQAAYKTHVQEERSHGKAEFQIGGALAWAKKLSDNPCQVTSIVQGGVHHIVGSNVYHGEPFHFELSEDLTQPFLAAYEELTGHQFLGAYWIKLLLFSGWEAQAQYHDLTGKPEAMGWTFVAATIPH